MSVPIPATTSTISPKHVLLLSKMASAFASPMAAAAPPSIRPTPFLRPSWLTYACGPAALVLSNPRVIPIPSIPLVPDVLVRHGIVNHTPRDPYALSENCLVRTVFSTGGGFVMGAFLGAALAGFGTMGMGDMSALGQNVTATQALKEGLVMMRNRAWGSAKNFALIGGVYSLVECPLESWRAKKDMKNAVITGAITGAVVAAKAGPKAMVLSASGFAVFGVVMETVFPNLFDFGGG